MFDTKDLNKADLHCHLAGSMSPSDLRILASISGMDLARFEPLEKIMKFSNGQIWTIIRKLFSSPKSISKALELFLAKAATDGVSYTEPIINLGKIIESGIDTDELTNSLVRSISEVRKKYNIESRVRIGVNRADGPIQARKMLDFFERYSGFCYAGIDINGNELNYPVEDFDKILIEFREKNVNFTLHAGEGSANEKSALRSIMYMPSRVGHGNVLVKHPETFGFLIKNNIALEICITSNVSLGVAQGHKSHPVRSFIENNIPIVLGTDNMAMFQTSLSREYQILLDLGVSIKKIEEIASRSLSYQ